MVSKTLPSNSFFLGNVSDTSEKGINCLQRIPLGGIEQWILIRGADVDNPLLLFLHGGPGAAQIAFAPNFQTELEKYFTIVNWDQRGSGKSYSPKIPKETMNICTFVKDTHDLVVYLLDRFRRHKLFLAAHSWGSIIGLLTVQKYPHLFHAYIGIGQAVDMQETARILCRYNYNAAKKTNNKKAFKELGGIGYPPNKGTSHDALLQIKWLEKFGGIFGKPTLKKDIKKMILFSKEYTVFDKLKYKTGSMFSFRMLFDELIEVNLFKEIPEIGIPAYFCVGCYDYNTPFNLTEEYYKILKAPEKKIFWFGRSGHAPHFEEPEKFTKIILDHVYS